MQENSSLQLTTGAQRLCCTGRRRCSWEIRDAFLFCANAPGEGVTLPCLCRKGYIHILTDKSLQEKNKFLQQDENLQGLLIKHGSQESATTEDSLQIFILDVLNLNMNHVTDQIKGCMTELPQHSKQADSCRNRMELIMHSPQQTTQNQNPVDKRNNTSCLHEKQSDKEENLQTPQSLCPFSIPYALQVSVRSRPSSACLWGGGYAQADDSQKVVIEEGILLLKSQLIKKRANIKELLKAVSLRI